MEESTTAAVANKKDARRTIRHLGLIGVVSAVLLGLLLAPPALASWSEQSAEDAILQMKPIRGGDMRTARKAYYAFQRGVSHGSWDDYLGLLHEDVTFIAPVPGFSGLQTGKAAATRMFAWEAEHVRVRLIPVQSFANGNEIAFEFRAEGQVKGKAGDYANQLCLVLVISGGKIIHFREYAAQFGGFASTDEARAITSYRTSR